MAKTKKRKPKAKAKSFGEWFSDQAPSLAKIGLGEDKEIFVENLAMLLMSGMDILSSLQAIKLEVRSKRFQRIIDKLSDGIDSGLPLWQVLEQAQLFSARMVALIRMGEETGNLAKNLQVIVVQQQKERIFKSKVRSAMMYPVLVLVITLAVGTGVAWFILPRLSKVFSQLKLDLPLITKALIAVGTFLNDYGMWVMPVLVFVVILLVYFIFFFKKTKFLGQRLLFSFPGIKKLIQEIELARFGYILGTLLDAGLPIVDALNSLDKAASFPMYKKLYGHLKKNIAEGNSFQASFASFPKVRRLFPSAVLQMLVAGEQTGHLADTLLRIGSTYEARTDTTTKNLAVLLEPILLVIVWVGVVGVALSVVLPIYSLIGGLNQTTDAPKVKAPIIEEVIIEKIIEPEPELVSITKLKILPTGLGVLNVRDQGNLAGQIITQVVPGEIYGYIDIQDDWYQIILSVEQNGWVFGQYIEIIEGNDDSES
jgi:type IV pilus assembly protein PilC